MFLKILFVIFIETNFVFTCEESGSDVTDTSYVSGEYLNIFKNIPTLFEYVLDIIEQKPGILEKDDVTVFTEDVLSLIDEVTSTDVNAKKIDSDMNKVEPFWFGLDWNKYPGVTGKKRFDLSSAEVAEKTLEVERQLEEYNNNKNKI